jgi:hypothetical protein
MLQVTGRRVRVTSRLEGRGYARWGGIRHHHGAHRGRDQRRPLRRCNARFHRSSWQPAEVRSAFAQVRRAVQDEARALCAIALGKVSSLG